MTAADVVLVRRAALLHGLGRVAVPNRIWDKPGRLSPGEWERVRLYPYFTDRILSRAPAFAELVRPASGVKERLDGGGYHRGLPAPAQPAPLRVLAAAAAYRSMTEERRHRPALVADAAAAQLLAEAAARRLDREAVGAVLEAAGHRRQRGAWPAGLTDREVEVLRQVARGNTNRQVADALHSSAETALYTSKHNYVNYGGINH